MALFRRVDPRIYFTTREQLFTITVYGLLPFTIHNLYFERRKVDSAKVRPLGGTLGDALKTDKDGSITIEFFYDTGITSEAVAFEQSQQKVNSVVGIKEIVLASRTDEDLPLDYKLSTLSYFTSAIDVQVLLVQENQFEEVRS